MFYNDSRKRRESIEKQKVRFAHNRRRELIGVSFLFIDSEKTVIHFHGCHIDRWADIRGFLSLSLSLSPSLSIAFSLSIPLSFSLSLPLSFSLFLSLSRSLLL